MDYYLVDAFWYDRASGFQQFRQPHWPDGPDRFLNLCQENNIKPGLWLPGNNQSPSAKLDVYPTWSDSWNPAQRSLCMFTGGYLPHLLEIMDLWYQRGVRAFKFDFLNFNAITPALERNMLPSEIRSANISAMQTGLKAFRAQHADVLLLGFNGFEERDTFSRTDEPLRKTIDLRWLETFDSLYCGDPRPADVPCMSFWRSKDIYSDHMVRYYEAMGFPFERIDNAGFMIGTTGTCYNRGAAAWKGMLLLSLARGGWVNTYYGNLELLDDESVRWFARAQALFLRFQQYGRCRSFGSLPGVGEGYGFLNIDESGSVAAVVNPAQQVARVMIPIHAEGRILFCDAGFTPHLNGCTIELGPEQMALVGFGAYATAEYDMGIMEDVHIPRSITPVEAQWEPMSDHLLIGRVSGISKGSLRVIVRQIGANGRAWRSTGGAPPKGITLGKILSIHASHAGRALDVRINYDKAIWSGLSWAVGEIAVDDSTLGGEISIECQTTETVPVTLQANLHWVEY